MRELLKIENIRLVAPPRFRTQKITCKPNLVIVMLDISHIPDDQGKKRRVWGQVHRDNVMSKDPTSLAQLLIVGSGKVNRLVLKGTKESLAIWDREPDGTLKGISVALGTQYMQFNVEMGSKYGSRTTSFGGGDPFVWSRR
jgi:hypothetical protein